MDTIKILPYYNSSNAVWDKRNPDVQYISWKWSNKTCYTMQLIHFLLISLHKILEIKTEQNVEYMTESSDNGEKS